jgi:hypothetical protein
LVSVAAGESLCFGGRGTPSVLMYEGVFSA